MSRRIVVVGGVAAGASAATRARRLDEKAEITVFEKSGHVSFANCGLPYYIGGRIEERSELLIMTPDKFWNEFRVRVHVRHLVESIDRENRRVRVRNLDNHQTSWHEYDQLILTPGAAPLKPPISGADAHNVFTLRTVEDADRIAECVASPDVKRAVVVGAGYIGLELTESFVERGLSVSVVELLPQVLAPFDADMAAMVDAELRDKEVDVHLGDAVESIITQGVLATGVKLKSGKEIDADLVILSIGVRPESQLAKDAGLKLNERGAIVVNEKLQTSDPNILAVGDAVPQTHGVTGKAALIPLAGPASRMGRLAGEFAVTGRSREPGKVMGTAVVKVFDRVAAQTGLTEKAAKAEGIDYDFAIIERPQHVAYYPGAQMMTIKLLYEKGTRRVLGAQIVGQDGVDRRIDVVSMLMQFGGTLDDLTRADLAYAPQFGAAKDPLHIAAQVALNQEEQIVAVKPFEQMEELRDAGWQLLDVRKPDEVQAGAVPGAKNIPHAELRDRLGELDRNKPVMTYCKSGQRAYVALRILKGAGWKDVAILRGSFNMFDLLYHDRVVSGRPD